MNSDDGGLPAWWYKQKEPDWKGQEKRLAKEVSGQRQPGSGNGPHKKLDVESTKFVIEAKTTTKQSYGVSVPLLNSIKKYAVTKYKRWALEIQFSKDGEIVYVISRDEFRLFRQLLKEKGI